MRNIDDLCNKWLIVATCTMLHNMCTNNNDMFDEWIEKDKR